MEYLAKQELLRRNPNLNNLVETSFQGVNRLLVLSFENDVQRTSNKRYYFPNVEIKDYYVMIDGENFFDQSVKNIKITYENIRKIIVILSILSIIILEEVKEAVLDFSQDTVKFLYDAIKWFNFYQYKIHNSIV